MSGLFHWFYQRAMRTGQRNHPFVIVSDDISISYEQFVNLVNSNSAMSVYKKIDAGCSVIVPFNYSVQTLVDVFTLLKENISVVLINPNLSVNTQMFCFANNISDFEIKSNIGPYHVVNNQSREGMDSVWLASSGATNRAVFWSHNDESVCWNIEEYCDVFNLGESSIFWTAFPPYSVSCWKALFILANCSGSILWAPYPSGMDLMNFFKLSERHSITSLAFPPVFAELLIAISERGAGTFSNKLHRVLCGGDFLSEKTYIEFVRRFDKQPNMIYGLTESAGPIMYVPEADWAPGSLGKMFRGDFAIQNNKESGLLVLHGNFLSKCIHGSYTTNDVVDVSGGYPRFVGRNSDIVTYKGQRISLLEIEESIMQLPQIKAARVFLKQDLNQVFAQLESQLSVEVVIRSDVKDFDVSEIQSKLPPAISAITVYRVEKLTRHSSTKLVRSF